MQSWHPPAATERKPSEAETPASFRVSVFSCAKCDWKFFFFFFFFFFKGMKIMSHNTTVKKKSPSCSGSERSLAAVRNDQRLYTWNISFVLLKDVALSEVTL